MSQSALCRWIYVYQLVRSYPSCTTLFLACILYPKPELPCMHVSSMQISILHLSWASYPTVVGVLPTGHEPALHPEVQLWKLQPGSLSHQDTLDGEKEWVGWEGFATSWSLSCTCTWGHTNEFAVCMLQTCQKLSTPPTAQSSSVNLVTKTTSHCTSPGLFTVMRQRMLF